MSEQSMIERVARSVCRASVTASPWCGHKINEAIDECWTDYIPEARAAIEAMREPSPAMLDAFVARALQVSVSSETGGWTGYAREQMATMIDAALKDAQ